MGSLLSLPISKAQDGELSELSQNDACKRQRMSSSYYDENPRLIPTLPDEISLQILARLPRIYYLNMKLVCRSWKAAITSHEVYHVRRELGTTEEWLYILTKVEENKLLWHALDPSSSKWQRLPLMPYVLNEGEPKRVYPGFWMWNVVGSSIKIADFIRGWLWRTDASDQMPFCGCAVAVVDGCLYVLGGFSRASIMKSVWKYDPCVNLWQEVSSMTIGRAFCKTAVLNNKLYVVGGINRGRNGLTPLRSAEVFDPQTGIWTQLSGMPFSKTQVIPAAFLANILKPIATGMASYRGRLCVPQSLYSWPFFFDVGGEIYDPENDSWAEMPAGMGDGWPAKQAGTKLSVVVNGELYALDPCSSFAGGHMKRYDYQEDVWNVVIQRVPVHDFTNSESPYLLAGFLGKLHVITKDGDNRVAILQADLQKHKQSSPSTSSAPPANFRPGNPVSVVDEETDIWKIIASENFGAAELVSCQVLDV